MPIIRFFALLIVVLSALNAGMFGFIQKDLVEYVLGSNSSLWARMAYVIAGFCGIYAVRFLFISANYVNGKKEHPEE
jgi:uncharacterized membrane protein YuzA (DUF378 family)